MKIGIRNKFFLFIAAMMLFCANDHIHAAETAQTVEYERIGIGAGGAFFEPLINPVDSNHYITFSDMGDLYWSLDAGASWERIETKTSFFSACFSEQGTVFVGGDGVYKSTGQAQEMSLIYPHPDTVKISVSRLGRNDDNILADGYDNGYAVCIDTYEDRVFFITLNWTDEHGMQLLSCKFDGTGLKQYYVIDDTGSQSPLEVNYNMVVEEDGIYYTDGYDIWFYEFASEEMSMIYDGEGIINDFEKIDNYFFVLDDVGNYTKILYTEDFTTYYDLNEYNDLSNSFERYGETFEHEWHFKFISGKDWENIFLNFYSEIDWRTYSGNNLGGIMKFDGGKFHWVFDSIHEPRGNFSGIGWSYGNYDYVYGVCVDPNDGNHCIVTDISTVYDMYYGNEVHDVKTLHSKMKEIDGIAFDGTKGLDCQTTYSVREDPFDSQHMIICTSDMGLQTSYDGGESFRRMELIYSSYENTCYDVYFDEQTEGVIYGLWSSRHDAPYTPALSDVNASGGFAVSYDGGITWDFSYSTGIPRNSIPVKMFVVPNEEELTIAVATFNNGFYVSYDSGKTFTGINEGMDAYEGMIWGEDIVLDGDIAWCLTAYHNFGELTPSVLYKRNLKTGELSRIDLGEIVIARSLTYDENYGLYINVIPYYYYGWIEEIQDDYFVNYGGGVYHCDEDGTLQLILSVENGVSHSAFSTDGTMYVSADKGIIYIKQAENENFEIYVDGLFQRMKNINFSRDETVFYATTFGGGTYRIPVYKDAAKVPEKDVHEHIPETVNGKVPTCTEEGYTGDVYCTICNVLMEAGSSISMTFHTEADPIVNDDESHSIYCIECGILLVTESCNDEDEDGYCDVCNSQLVKNTYIIDSGLSNGEQYLLVNSGITFGRTVTPLEITLNLDEECYELEGKFKEEILWTYEDGYLYTVYNETVYYLSVQRQQFYLVLMATTDKSEAASWSYENGCLLAKTPNFTGRYKLYLSIAKERISVVFYMPNKTVLYRKC